MSPVVAAFSLIAMILGLPFVGEKVPELSGRTVEEILTNLPAISDITLRTAIQNNGGGYYNHNLYFQLCHLKAAESRQGFWQSKLRKISEVLLALRKK
ncbi:MAG: hypothetical protein PHQ46_00495 [Negativicutes bacterium]|nr:hypothetical protein [Negativicutes bacterium]